MIYVHQLYYIVLDKKHAIEFIRPSFHMHYFKTLCFTKFCTKLQIKNMRQATKFDLMDSFC